MKINMQEIEDAQKMGNADTLLDSMRTIISEGEKIEITQFGDSIMAELSAAEELDKFIEDNF